MPKYEVVQAGTIYCDRIEVEADSVADAVKKVDEGDTVADIQIETYEPRDPSEWLVYDEEGEGPYYVNDEVSTVHDRERYLGVVSSEGFIRAAKLCDVYKDAEQYVIDYFKEAGFDPAEDDGKVLVLAPETRVSDPEEVYAVSALDDLAESEEEE